MSEMTAQPDTPEATKEQVFVQAEQPRASIGVILLSVLGSLLMVAGMWVTSLAFSVPGREILLFLGGIVISSLGFWLALGFLTERASK